MKTTMRSCLPVIAAMPLLAPMLGNAADVNLKEPPPKAANRTPLTIAGPGSERIIEFALWKSALQTSDIVGEISSSMFCSSTVPLSYSKKVDEWFTAQMAKGFRTMLARQGYAVPDAAGSVFEDKSQNGADFRVGATLLALDYRTCFSGEDMKGQVYSKIKWEVFAARRQKVVYSSIVESSYVVPSSIPSQDFGKGLTQVIVGNLLGDPKFLETVRTGGLVDALPAKVFSPLSLGLDPTVKGEVARQAKELQRAVVTVESAAGSGTAFYVGRAGYLLTNYHVVSDAKFVRVKLADGRSLVGEVLRVDKARDVALLQTDPVAFDVLGLRREPMQVGEEVYSLGSPFGATLSGTLTRGVLSSRRVIEGVAYLQSDVAINPGNSGGPLVDAKGQVVGLAQLSLEAAQGIGLFIPVDEALDKLALTIPGAVGNP